nr:hypothetical protein [uncultured Actinotalea sp.]
MAAPDGTEHEHDDAPDLAVARTLIAEQRARVEAATDVDARVLFGAWGMAWLVGFTALWLALREDPVVARQAGFAVFGVALSAAAVVTAVHLARRSSGVRGGSAVQGAMYGWAWFLAFGGVFALGAGLDRTGAPFLLVAHAQTVVSALLVAALYMAGGAMWGDRTQFVLGAWIAVVTAAGAVVGPPHTLLVMALAGGGGMLVAALAHHLRRARREALP